MFEIFTLLHLRTPGIKSFILFSLSCLFFSMILLIGCSRVSNIKTHARPVGAYLINYSSASHKLSMQSIDVTPPSAGEDISGKAGLFQSGNAVFDGLAVTAPVFITNNTKDDWTGVVMQAYGLQSGSATVCDADQGSDWYEDNPEYGAWGWVFTSGTAGSEFTVPMGGRSAVTPMGFHANSDFVSVVYIYAGAPIIQDAVPDDAPSGATVTITGYNFSGTAGSVTFNGITGTVQSWSDRQIVVTVPPNGATGDIIVHTVDPDMPFSNPFRHKKYAVSIDCSTPGPNPVNAGSTMSCTVYAQGGKPVIDSSADTCGGNLSEGGYCGENWTYTFSPSAGQVGTCTAAVINGTATAQDVVTTNAPQDTCGENIINVPLTYQGCSFTPGVVNWTYNSAFSWIGGTVAIGQNNSIYVPAGWSNIFSLDSLGNLLWHYNSGNYDSYAGPVALTPDGIVYAGAWNPYSGSGTMYAVNSATGSLLWKQGIGPAQNLAVDSDGSVYVITTSGLFAFTKDGSLKWNLLVPGTFVSIGADNTIYYSAGNALYALNPDGTSKWVFNVNPAYTVQGLAVGANNNLYFNASNTASNSSCLYSLSSGGTLSWVVSFTGTTNGGPTIGFNNTLYVGTVQGSQGGTYSFDNTGKLNWVFGTSYEMWQAPTIGSDGSLYMESRNVSTNQGCFYALNSNGYPEWSVSTVGGDGLSSVPNIAQDGTIYLGTCESNSSGVVYSIKSNSAGLAATPWPKQWHDATNSSRAGAPLYLP